MSLNFIQLEVKSSAELAAMTEAELIAYKSNLEATQKKN